MVNVNGNSYKSLSNRLKILNESEWKLIHNHLNQALKHFEMGFSNSEYFRDCISRTNKVFEGVIKKIYSIARLIPNVNPNLDLIGKIINELKEKIIIPTIFSSKLKIYKNDIRNKETHEIYEQFGEEDAKKALRDAYIFIFLGLEIENILSNNIQLTEYNILMIYLNSFLASFDEYTNSIKLYYENIFNYIYPVNKKKLKSELLDFYKNSIFKDEFKIKKHQIINKLRPDFEIEYGSIKITFSIIKIDESSVMHATFSERLKDRLLNYKRNFDELFFLLWIFTRRNSKVDIIFDNFSDVPHYIMFQMKRKKSKRLKLEEFKENYSIEDFYK